MAIAAADRRGRRRRRRRVARLPVGPAEAAASPATATIGIAPRRRRPPPTRSARRRAASPPRQRRSRPRPARGRARHRQPPPGSRRRHRHHDQFLVTAAAATICNNCDIDPRQTAPIYGASRQSSPCSPRSWIGLLPLVPILPELRGGPFRAAPFFMRAGAATPADARAQHQARPADGAARSGRRLCRRLASCPRPPRSLSVHA